MPRIVKPPTEESAQEVASRKLGRQYFGEVPDISLDEARARLVTIVKPCQGLYASNQPQMQHFGRTLQEVLQRVFQRRAKIVSQQGVWGRDRSTREVVRYTHLVWVEFYGTDSEQASESTRKLNGETDADSTRPTNTGGA